MRARLEIYTVLRPAPHQLPLAIIERDAVMAIPDRGESLHSKVYGHGTHGREEIR